MGRIAGIVVVTAVLAVLAPGRFGGHRAGPLRWDGAPRTSALGMSSGARLLFGHVVNRSDRVARLRAADVHVLDSHSRRLPGSAAFADGFVPGVALLGSGREVFAAGADGAAVGGAVVLAPGRRAPLSVSFTTGAGVHATAIDYGGGGLALKWGERPDAGRERRPGCGAGGRAPDRAGPAARAPAAVAGRGDRRNPDPGPHAW